AIDRVDLLAFLARRVDRRPVLAIDLLPVGEAIRIAAVARIGAASKLRAELAARPRSPGRRGRGPTAARGARLRARGGTGSRRFALAHVLRVDLVLDRLSGRAGGGDQLAARV